MQPGGGPPLIRFFPVDPEGTVEGLETAVQAIYDRIGIEGAGAPPALPVATGAELARALGYPAGDLERVPRGVLAAFVGAAPLSTYVEGPGPVADLGCGAGLDAWILALRGYRVAALDASAPMLARLRLGGPPPGLYCVRGRLPRVPFRGGWAGWVLLNGVANLVPGRPALIRELYRILKPGGRVCIGDLVRTAPLPPGLEELPEAWAWCVAGAVPPDRWRRDLEEAGFRQVSVDVLEEIPPLARAVIRAAKPGP